MDGKLAATLAEGQAGALELFACLGPWLPLAAWKCCNLLVRFDVLHSGESVHIQHGTGPLAPKLDCSLGGAEAFKAWLDAVHGRTDGRDPASDSVD